MASLSRRDILKFGGGAAAGAILGIGGWEASRRWSVEEGPHERSAAAADPTPQKPEPTDSRNLAPAPKQIIDTHVHVVPSNLAGTPSQPDDEPDPREGPIETVAKRIAADLKSAGIEHALCMPRRDREGADALGVERTRQLARLVPGLHPIGLADPERTSDAHLARVEESLEKGDIVALKAYLGYLHFAASDAGYVPYYKLAAKYKIPVIFHTGDTYSHLARLKYAHPLPIDDVLVDFPETNFVLAHLGNPWLIDAAELVYKNNKPKQRENVWADLSGLLVGEASDFARLRKEGMVAQVMSDVRKAIEYSERPDRFLFGSDWPLAPFDVYRDFIAELVPAALHQQVFYENAKTLFRLE